MIYTIWGMGDIDTLRLYQFFPLVNYNWVYRRLLALDCEILVKRKRLIKIIIFYYLETFR